MLSSPSSSQSLTAPQESDTHHDTSTHEHGVDYCTIHLSMCDQCVCVCVLINRPLGNFPAFPSLCSHSSRDNVYIYSVGQSYF